MHGFAPGDGNFDIIHHLPHAHFDGQERLRNFDHALEGRKWKRIEADRAEQADGNPFALALLNRRAGDAGGRAIRNDNHARLVTIVKFVTNFLPRHFRVFFIQMQDVGFQFVGIKKQRVDHAAAASAISRAGGCPLFRRQIRARRVGLDVHRLHDLPNHAIGQNHHRVAVQVSEIERGFDQFDRFLKIGRR